MTASDATKTYGQTAALYGYSVSGLVNGDSVSSVSLTSAGTAATANVRDYGITASSASGSGLSNYTISYVGSTLTVNPATLTITASDAAKTYGQTAALYGYSVSGLVNGDSVSSVSLTSAGTAATANVGDYAITAGSASGSGLSNYTISYVGSNLTVNPATLTITAADAVKTYGQTATLRGYSVSGLVNSDSVDSVTLSSDGTDATAKTGKYGITVSNARGSGFDNYNIIYRGGILTVTEGLGQDNGYQGAVVSATSIVDNCRPTGRYGPEAGYMTEANGSLLFNIVPPGLNISGYVPLTVLANSGQSDD
ncbi:MBG domain-containing protein [Sporomusa ovata]|uniref:MBG domain-containing protein n=1 Tax=Sporomusa ovata TaxID=2378 RepID=UPI0030CECE64